MDNFLKKYWLKIINKQKNEEKIFLKRNQHDKNIFQNKFESQINNFHKKISQANHE